MYKEGKNRARYRKIVQTVPDVLYEIDMRGRFIFVSEGIKIFGYDPDELLGKKFVSVIHPEDAKKVTREIILPKYRGKKTGETRAPKLFNERRTKRRMTKNLEARLLAGPGKKAERDVFYVEVHSSGVWKNAGKNKQRVFEGTLGIFRDVTHRKFFELNISHRYKDLFRIIEKNPDGMIVVNQKEEIVFANQAAQKFYRKKEKALVGTLFEMPPGGKGHIEMNSGKTSGKKTILGVMTIEVEWEGEICYLVSLRDETESYTLREMFCEASMRDELTDLYNRRAFVVLGQQQIKISKRKKEYLYVLFADVDKLKQINDDFGHAEGDRALVEVADSMRGVFRESDILARISGDEFVMMGVAAGKKDVEVAKTRWAKHLAFINEVKGLPYSLSVSIGDVCEVPSAKTDIENMLARADKKMYAVKKRRARE